MMKLATILLSVIMTGLMLVGVLFVNLSPQFGGSAQPDQLARFEKSPNYGNGKFHNQENIELEMSLSDMGKSLIGYFRPPAHTVPKENIPVLEIDSIDLVKYSGETRLFWFGHSAFLLQMNGKNILIDPMFGEVPAPHALLGSKRFSNKLPINIQKLPKIDAIIISHDHYDHLDYGSIMKLKDKVNMFYTPLGVGAHLREWGVDKQHIVELDWWDQVTHQDLVFRCTPAQHFSGRGLSDRASTLWSSWIITSDNENLFFSGDSGYGPHFAEIGHLYGPFDFAMLECGQYNTMWPEVHMFPEETAQAAIDIKAEYIMPIHWGAFKLSMHPWTEPVERLNIATRNLKLKVVMPRIGHPIELSQPISNNKDPHWWSNY